MYKSRDPKWVPVFASWWRYLQQIQKEIKNAFLFLRSLAELAPGPFIPCDGLFGGTGVYWSQTPEGGAAVYLDLFMLLNFGVDYLLLLGTERLSGGSPDRKGILLASALGAIYSGGCLAPGFSFLGSHLWRIVFLGLMSILAFGVQGNAWRKAGVFLILSMALGGLATLAGKGRLWNLCLCGCILWCLCRAAFGNGFGRSLVPLEIRLGEQKLRMTALKDTGNTLLDPITGEHVLVIGGPQAECLTGFTREQLEAPMDTLMQNPRQGLRLIPYHAVGQQGMLLGMRIQDVRWDGKKRSSVVAFAPEELGAGEFQALLGGMA